MFTNIRNNFLFFSEKLYIPVYSFPELICGNLTDDGCLIGIRLDLQHIS